ncbi:MAG: hypothetical protein ABEK59_04160 [Halobacteria archaeon]
MRKKILTALLILTLIGLTGCIEQQKPDTSEDVINKSKAALDDVKSFSYEGRVLVDNKSYSPSESADADLFSSLKGDVNHTSGRLHRFINDSGNLSTPGINNKKMLQDTYLVNDTYYYRLINSEENRWIKRELPGMRAREMRKSRIQILEDVYSISNVSLNGEDSISGKDVYRIDMEPKIRELERVSDSVIGPFQLIISAGSPLKSAKYSYWVDQDNYQPVKLRSEISAISKYSTDNGDKRQSKIFATEILNFSGVNEPTNIKIPRDARNAGSIENSSTGG